MFLQIVWKGLEEAPLVTFVGSLPRWWNHVSSTEGCESWIPKKLWDFEEPSGRTAFDKSRLSRVSEGRVWENYVRKVTIPRLGDSLNFFTCSFPSKNSRFNLYLARWEHHFYLEIYRYSMKIIPQSLQTILEFVQHTPNALQQRQSQCSRFHGGFKGKGESPLR